MSPFCRDFKLHSDLPKVYLSNFLHDDTDVFTVNVESEGSTAAYNGAGVNLPSLEVLLKEMQSDGNPVDRDNIGGFYSSD